MEEMNGAHMNKTGGFVIRLVALVVVVACLAIFPFVITNRFYISLLNEMMIYGLLAMSLDVLLGYTGLLSFMHNAYLGIGAYMVGLFLIHVAPSSMWLALLMGVVGTTLIAVPVGWVQVRTGGLAFALLTLAFGMMFFTVAWKWYDLTGGDDGLMGVPHPDVQLGGWVLGNSGDPTVMYLLTLAILLICLVVTWRIIHSPSVPYWKLFGKMKTGHPLWGSTSVNTNFSVGPSPACWPASAVDFISFIGGISDPPPCMRLPVPPCS